MQDLSIICFLFAPLLITDSFRISRTNQTQVNVQLDNQRQQVEQLTLQLDNLGEKQINSLWARNQQSAAPNLNISPTEQKQQLVSKIGSAEQANRKQLKQKLRKKNRSLFKMTFKWILGAIVAGVSFVSIWKYTEWARVIQAVDPGQL